MVITYCQCSCNFRLGVMETIWGVLLLLSIVCPQITVFGTQPTTPLPLPNFIPTQINFTYTEGELARLECAVENLSTKKVIWRRASDPNPLTIGKRTFVEDKRVLIEHVALEKEWNLIIKRVRIDDEGVYECQISSKLRHLRHNVLLTVIPRKGPPKRKGKKTYRPSDVEKATNVSGGIYDIQLAGGKYVEKGHIIYLTCNATGEEHPPDDLDWFKNGDKLSTDYNREIFIQKRVSLTTKTIVSILEIRDAKMSDAGVYICRTSDLQITSIRINVLNANTYNVKRGTEIKPDTPTKSGSEQNKSSENGVSGLIDGGALVILMFCLLISKLVNDT